LPAGVEAAHMFNHGIRHRGQLTTLLKQARLDPGVTEAVAVARVAQIVG
jgi:uncharacterized damage-inducible protein DinB